MTISTEMINYQGILSSISHSFLFHLFTTFSSIFLLHPLAKTFFNNDHYHLIGTNISFPSKESIKKICISRKKLFLLSFCGTARLEIEFLSLFIWKLSVKVVIFAEKMRGVSRLADTIFAIFRYFSFL